MPPNERPAPLEMRKQTPSWGQEAGSLRRPRGSPPSAAQRVALPAEACQRRATPDPGRRAGRARARPPADGSFTASPSWPPPAPRGSQAHQLPQGARHVVPSSQSAGRGHSTISPPTIKNHITRGVEPAAFHWGVCPASRSPRLSPLLRPGDTAATPTPAGLTAGAPWGRAHISHGWVA